MNDFIEWELIQDDCLVVACNDWNELQHYISQYIQDGPIEIWEVRRKLIKEIE